MPVVGCRYLSISVYLSYHGPFFENYRSVSAIKASHAFFSSYLKFPHSSLTPKGYLVKLTLMYGVGFITLAFSAARIHAVLNDNLSTKGWLLSQFNFVTWGTIEAFTAIICVNIPCLVAGFKKWHYRRTSLDGDQDYYHSDHFLQGSNHHQDRSPLASQKASHLYMLHSVSSIHTNAFSDATNERKTSENTKCIKVTQEFRTDIEMNRHGSGEHIPSSIDSIA